MRHAKERHDDQLRSMETSLQDNTLASLSRDTDLSSPAPELSTSQYQAKRQPDHHVAEPARRLGLL